MEMSAGVVPAGRDGLVATVAEAVLLTMPSLRGPVLVGRHDLELAVAADVVHQGRVRPVLPRSSFQVVGWVELLVLVRSEVRGGDELKNGNGWCQINSLPQHQRRRRRGSWPE
jgi:hypothetical protein